MLSSIKGCIPSKVVFNHVKSMCKMQVVYFHVGDFVVVFSQTPVFTFAWDNQKNHNYNNRHQLVQWVSVPNFSSLGGLQVVMSMIG